MELCKDCGEYQALSWGKGYCLRCWFKTDDPPATNEQLEIDDICPRCESIRLKADELYCENCQDDFRSIERKTF